MTPPHLDIHCVELRGMQLGLRQAWRLRLRPEHVGRFRSRLEALGHHVVVSGERYEELEGGVLRRSNDGVLLAVVATRRAIAEECLRLERENTSRDRRDVSMMEQLLSTHRLLGATYGYPDCCVDAFCDAHAQSVLDSAGLADNAWIIARAAHRSRSFHPLLRAFGSAAYAETASPLRHLPCRFDCDASIELAGALLRDLERSNPPLRAAYRNTPVIDLVVREDGSITAANGGAAALASDDPLRPADQFPLLLPFRGQRYVPTSE